METFVLIAAFISISCIIGMAGIFMDYIDKRNDK